MRGGALAGKKSLAFENFKGTVLKTIELNALISAIDALKRAGLTYTDPQFKTKCECWEPP